MPLLLDVCNEARTHTSGTIVSSKSLAVYCTRHGGDNKNSLDVYPNAWVQINDTTDLLKLAILLSLLVYVCKAVMMLFLLPAELFTASRLQITIERAV